MFVGAIIVVAYTFLGGFRAVCLTDTIQAVLMFFALLLIPIVALFMLGDGGAALGTLDPNMFSLFHDPTTGEFVSVFVIVSGLAWGFGYFGQPHILPRFMGIENPEDSMSKHLAANKIWYHSRTINSTTLLQSS